MKILQIGAEATIYLNKDRVIKQREKKLYRIPQIDLEKTKYPTRREAKMLSDAKRFGVNVPSVLFLDEDRARLEIEYLKGVTLKEDYDNLKNKEDILKEFGRQIAILHDYDIIHGDLTTSNVILHEKMVYLIDFGLSFYSSKIEDKAVDIHLLKQVLQAKHYKNFEEDFSYIMGGYKNSKNYVAVIERLKKVEKRGRYKHKSG